MDDEQPHQGGGVSLPAQLEHAENANIHTKLVCFHNIFSDICSNANGLMSNNLPSQAVGTCKQTNVLVLPWISHLNLNQFRP